jgi:hypothetical protein
MQILTEDAILKCNHGGLVAIKPSQDLVTIESREVLVEVDPEKKSISGCPNVGVAIKPCQLTLTVQAGYSDLIRIKERRACLDTITGLTEGTPPGTVHYRMRDPGQEFVSENG